MILYICPECGYWSHTIMSQAAAEALATLFYGAMSTMHTCPTCQVAMVAPAPGDCLRILGKEDQAKEPAEKVIKWRELSTMERDALVAEKVLHRVVPTHYTMSLDKAWDVVKEMNKEHNGSYRRQNAFISYLEEVLDITLIGSLMDTITYPHPASIADKICIAALRACGYEVEY